MYFGKNKLYIYSRYNRNKNFVNKIFQEYRTLNIADLFGINRCHNWAVIPFNIVIAI